MKLAKEMESVDLGDKRLNKRLIQGSSATKSL